MQARSVPIEALASTSGGTVASNDALLSNHPSETVPAYSRGSQDAREGSSLDRPIPMNRYRDRIGNVRMPKNVMAAADPLDIPALLFEDGDDLLAADRRKL